MEMKQSSEKRLALLIDADNVSAKYLKPIMDELSKYGTVTYKRIYGDWTLTLHAKWKDTLLENSITPIQQFGYTQGKNATDSAMIIDAMDILYTRSVEGFCIVSSDSDFTRLAARIRESGLTVIGMGEKKTPTPFRKACDIFTTLELLLGDEGIRGNRNKAKGTNVSANQGTGQALAKDEVEQAVVNIITDNQNNGKSTGLGEVGSRLLKRYPDFDVRSYGTNLLSKLLDEFERVAITKDGSSVTVELAEDKDREKSKSDTVHAATSSPGRDKAGRRTNTNGRAKDEPALPNTRDDSPVAGEVVQGRDEVRHEARKGQKKADSDNPMVSSSPDLAATKSAANASEATADETSEASPKPWRTPRNRTNHADQKSSDKQTTHTSANRNEGRVSSMEGGVRGQVSPTEAKHPGKGILSSTPEQPVKTEPKPKRVSRGGTGRGNGSSSGSESDNTKTPSAGDQTSRAQSNGDRTEIDLAKRGEPTVNPEQQPSSTTKASSRRRPSVRARMGASEMDTSDKPVPARHDPSNAQERAADKTPSTKKAVQATAADISDARKNQAADTEDFIRQLLREAGSEGISLAELGKRVRAKFRTFKLRDLGYSQFKTYVADLGDIDIEARGKEFYARFGE